MTDINSIVFYSQSTDRSGFVDKILTRFKEEITGKILVKVNLVSHEPYPTTTHPDMLEAVLKYLQGKDISVGDGPAIDIGKFRKEKTDIYKICKQFDVPFVNFYDLEMQTLKSPSNYELTFSNLPSQCDYIISLPILKIHIECSITGALKNAFGYLSKKNRLLMHMGKKNIHQGIAELNTFVKPNLTIMDGIKTLINANEVRHGGLKRNLGYLLAGKDPVALDVYGFSLLKKIDPTWAPNSPQDIPHVKNAIDLGIGNPDYKLYEIK
ncbi:MAG: DUF362 domain-containing protein [Promethearchaeota archaeon]